MGWGSLGSTVGSPGARALVILVLRECIWNAPVVSLFLPAFEDTGFLGSPPSRMVYPLVPPRVTASRFLAGNGEAELKRVTFSSLLLFCLSSSHDLPAACCGYSLIINVLRESGPFPDL